MTISDLTEEKKREYLEEACQALEANPLKAKRAMRSKAGGRCCLCVMLDTMFKIAARDGIDLIFGDEETAEDENYPPATMGIFYGLPRVSPRSEAAPNDTQFDFELGDDLASRYNDGVDVPEKTHAEIAQMIREQYLS